MDRSDDAQFIGEQVEYEGNAAHARNLIFILFKIFTAAGAFIVMYHILSLPLSKILNKENSLTIVNTSLFVLATLWMYGTQFDTYINIEAVRFSKHKPSFTRKEVIICSIVLIIFIALLLTAKYPIAFVITLVILQLYNIYAYRYLVKNYYGDEFVTSLKIAKEKYCPEHYPFMYIRTLAAYDYLFAKWPFVKLYTSLLYYLICLTVCLFIDIDRVLHISINEFVAYAFILHIVYSELWIYYMRLKFKFACDIARRYCGKKCCLL